MTFGMKYDLYIIKLIRGDNTEECTYCGPYSSNEIQTYMIETYGYYAHSENSYVIARKFTGDNERYKYYKRILESEIRDGKIKYQLK